MKWHLLIAVLGAALAGCGDATVPTVRHAVDAFYVATARQHWRSRAIHDYQYTLGYDCFCVARQMVVTVLDDAIYSATDLSTGRPVSPTFAMTVDDLFDVITTGLKNKVRVEASFDADLWYPRSILYNAAGLANDTGGSYGASDLHAVVVLKGDASTGRPRLPPPDADQRPR